MIVSKYEQEIHSVQHAQSTSANMDLVVKLLKNNPQGLTCKELGNMIYGDAYNWYPVNETYRNREKRQWNLRAKGLASHLGRMLGVLRDNHHIEVKKIVTDELVFDNNGEPITIEKTVKTECEEPYTIMAYDNKGRAYEVHNPDWRPTKYRKEKVQVHRVRRVYIWREAE